MPSHVLEEIRVDNSHSVVACKEQMISRWVNYHSLASPHCLWSLVKALKGIGENRVAKEIEDKYGNSCNNCTRLVLLQIHLCNAGVTLSILEKLVESQYSDKKPDDDFLRSFARVIGNYWPFLASLLSLTAEDVEEIKIRLPEADRALQMLRKWSTRSEATYGQLCISLKVVGLPLFH